MSVFHILLGIGCLLALLWLVSIPFAVRKIARGVRDVSAGRKPFMETLKGALIGVGAIFLVVLLLAGGTLVVVSKVAGGPGPIGVMWAAGRYLKEQHGPWKHRYEVSVKQHVEMSRDPASGYYVLAYTFDEYRGTLKAVYSDYAKNKRFTFEELKGNAVTPESAAKPREER